jgi:hypothetical protein
MPERQVFFQAKSKGLKVVLPFKNETRDRRQVEASAGQHSLPARHDGGFAISVGDHRRIDEAYLSNGMDERMQIEIV